MEISWWGRGGRLDIDSDDLPLKRFENDVDFSGVAFSEVEESRVGAGPAKLFASLARHECFEHGAEVRAAPKGVVVESHESDAETGIDHVQLWVAR